MIFKYVFLSRIKRTSEAFFIRVICIFCYHSIILANRNVKICTVHNFHTKHLSKHAPWRIFNRSLAVYNAFFWGTIGNIWKPTNSKLLWYVILSVPLEPTFKLQRSSAFESTKLRNKTTSEDSEPVIFLIWFTIWECWKLIASSAWEFISPAGNFTYRWSL